MSRKTKRLKLPKIIADKTDHLSSEQSQEQPGENLTNEQAEESEAFMEIDIPKALPYLGIVALVGRPNVGKSTLFNQMARCKAAIVDDQPGVTRDRLYRRVETDDHCFDLIDTGGFEANNHMIQPFKTNIVWQQAVAAMDEADVIVFVLDGKSGLHPFDRIILDHIRKTQKKCITIVNKIDGLEHGYEMADFFTLGIDDMSPVSAAHNRGVWELRDDIITYLQTIAPPGDLQVSKADIRFSLIGKPNAGKSSILNSLDGRERAIVSEVAGTTRDAIEIQLKHHEKVFEVVDTAGLRRKSKISERIEGLSVAQSLRSIEQSHVVVLVIDALEGISDQDAKILTVALGRGKPTLLVVNKWDLVPNKETNTSRDYERNLKERYLPDCDYLPVLFTSAKTGQRVAKILDKVEDLYKASLYRAPTAALNEALETMIARHTPQIIRKYSKRIKFFFATQVAVCPPTIVVKCNVEDEIQESYKRYMMNQFRQRLGYGDVPIRIFYRGKKEQNQRMQKVNPRDRQVLTN